MGYGSRVEIHLTARQVFKPTIPWVFPYRSKPDGGRSAWNSAGQLDNRGRTTTTTLSLPRSRGARPENALSTLSDLEDDKEEAKDPQVPAPRRSGRVSSKPAQYSPDHYTAQEIHDRAHCTESRGSLLTSTPLSSAQAIHRRAHVTLADADRDQALLTTESKSEDITTPKTRQQALASEQKVQWQQAMDEEIESLSETGTFRVDDLPPGVRPLGTKWVFKVKLGSRGDILRYKARLVAKGFKQVAGEHYSYTYSPTLYMASLRIFLVVSMSHRWDLDQVDVKTAFLIPELPADEEVWVYPPPGITLSPGKAWRLLKCIYGLKQSNRSWFLHFSRTLRELGYKPTPSDRCLYVLIEGGVLVSIAFHYVDDGVIAGPPAVRRRVLRALERAYPLKKLGRPTWLLGMSTSYCLDRGPLLPSARQYIEQMLARFGYTQMNPAPTPASGKLSKADCPAEPQKEVVSRQRQIVGAIGWVVMGTRPDTAYAWARIARYAHNPGPAHIAAAKRLLRYLVGTKGLALVFHVPHSSALPLLGYADSDWAGEADKRRSTGGYVFLLCGCAVAWSSKLIRSICLSSAEAELVTLSATSRAGIWLVSVLKGLGITDLRPLVIHEDNRAAFLIAYGDSTTKNLKHVDIAHFYVQQLVEDGRVAVKPISGNENPADITTKAVPKALFIWQREAIGLAIWVQEEPASR